MGTSMESAARTTGRLNTGRTIVTNMTLFNPEDKDTINQDLRKAIRCYYCNGLNHIARNCTALLNM